MKYKLPFALTLAAASGLTLTSTAPAAQCDPPTLTLVASGYSSFFGSTIGPDGALYVTEPEFGTILRLDPQTDQVSTFATGLPILWPDGLGVTDIEFVGNTAYALVTLVDRTVGGTNIDGIYRMDGPNLFTPIADIGLWARNHPPHTDFELPTGLQYAFQPFRNGFLVTDGHHNRVYSVSLAGHVSELIAFEDVVPTGIVVHGKDIYMTELGPVPCLPEDGKVVAFRAKRSHVKELASGAPMVLDAKFDCHGHLYGLSQGVFPDDGNPGDPALPDTGSIVMADSQGAFSPIVKPLNQPTSFQIMNDTDTGYVFTLNGEIWKVENLVCPSCQSH